MVTGTKAIAFYSKCDPPLGWLCSGKRSNPGPSLLNWKAEHARDFTSTWARREGHILVATINMWSVTIWNRKHEKSQLPRQDDPLELQYS